ncbi:hypothetical protein M9H77_03089 [Catharanthus roseus]|uniref:Uncharacterized protein n=1 Tax=Catharanthus roseus TaxID=4058 RepID=A0ACC0CAA5_CATRO|nr:hypothetical protein M9H77_03089 [Catharanthus roseus]
MRQFSSLGKRAPNHLPRTGGLNQRNSHSGTNPIGANATVAPGAEHVLAYGGRSFSPTAETIPPVVPPISSGPVFSLFHLGPTPLPTLDPFENRGKYSPPDPPLEANKSTQKLESIQKSDLY